MQTTEPATTTTEADHAAWMEQRRLDLIRDIRKRVKRKFFDDLSYRTLLSLSAILNPDEDAGL